MLETLTPYAPIISAGSAIISAVAVFISTWFVIWTTYFRKTRRDRVDELKEEIQLSLSLDWADRIVVGENDVEDFFKILKPKFQKTRYKLLHQWAYNELGYEGKNKAVNMAKALQEDRRYRQEVMRQERRDRSARHN